MKKPVIVVLVLLPVVLGGCGNQTDTTAVQTVPWYKEHDGDRKSMMERCKADPGRLAATPNCLNAQRAENEVANARRGWVMPTPVDFDKKGAAK